MVTVVSDPHVFLSSLSVTMLLLERHSGNVAVFADYYSAKKEESSQLIIAGIINYKIIIILIVSSSPRSDTN